MVLQDKDDENVKDADFSNLGEIITVRDFYGRLVDTIRVRADGAFMTSRGTLEPKDLGLYVLQVSGHPARGRHATEVV
jgi:hypothetical protein